MIAKIRLVFDKKKHKLEIHQEGVDIDDMAIGRIYNVAEVCDERVTHPESSKYTQMVKAFDPTGREIAWFWRADIESVEVVE